MFRVTLTPNKLFAICALLANNMLTNMLADMFTDMLANMLAKASFE